MTAIKELPPANTELRIPLSGKGVQVRQLSFPQKHTVEGNPILRDGEYHNEIRIREGTYWWPGEGFGELHLFNPSSTAAGETIVLEVLGQGDRPAVEEYEKSYQTPFTGRFQSNYVSAGVAEIAFSGSDLGDPTQKSRIQAISFGASDNYEIVDIKLLQDGSVQTLVLSQGDANITADSNNEISHKNMADVISDLFPVDLLSQGEMEIRLLDNSGNAPRITAYVAGYKA